MRKTIWILCMIATAGFACGDDSGDALPDAGGEAGRGDAGTRDAMVPDAAMVPDDAPVEVDRSQYADVGLDAPLDYSDMGMWACHPNLANNECHANLDATELRPDGGRVVVPHERAENPEFDCFYVYPTVLTDGRPNMVDFSEPGLELVRDPLYSQAARFSRLCEVYAPLYRQSGLNGAMAAEGADREIGLQDVRDAFAHYLEHDNRGRKFVLMGHSQGAFVLTSLIQMDIDEVPEVRERMLSAVLLGARVQTGVGEPAGGSFENIPVCEQPGDTGCVLAYVSYAEDTPPDDMAVFGRDGAGTQAVCTDPVVLADRTGLLSGSYYPMELNNAAFRSDWDPPEGIETPFLLYREVLGAQCVRQNGASYLEISTDLEAGDPRMPPHRSAIESIGWGLHLTDFNNALEDLIEAVRLQAEAGL